MNFKALWARLWGKKQPRTDLDNLQRLAGELFTLTEATSKICLDEQQVHQKLSAIRQELHKLEMISATARALPAPVQLRPLQRQDARQELQARLQTAVPPTDVIQ